MSENKQEDGGQPVAAGDNKYAHLKAERGAAAIRGAFWSAVNALVPTLLSSLVFVVTSRFLLPQEFGLVALAGGLIMFASAIAPAAFGEAIIQYINVRKEHLDTVFWFCIASAAVLYTGLMLLIPAIVTMTDQPMVAAYLPVLGTKLFFDLAGAVPNALIARSMSFHLIALRTTVSSIISAAVCLTLLFLGYGAWALALSQLTVAIVSCTTAFLGAKWRPGFDVSLQPMRDLWRYGIFASGNRFLQLMSIDQIIVGSLMGPAQLGILNFSRRLYQMMNDVMAGTLTSVSHTLLSSLQTEREKIREAFLIATFASSVISFPAFVGLASIASDAIPLVFGSHWIDAVWPTRGFCMIGLLSCIGIIQSSLINSQGKSDWWFYYQLLRQVLTIITILLLHDWGLNYILGAMVIQTFLLWPITIRMVCKIIDLSFFGYLKQFVAPLSASLAMLAAVILIGYALADATPVVRLICQVATGALVYPAAIFALSRKRLMPIVEMVLKKKARRRT